MINHVNLPDGNGNIYCCLRNRIVRLEAGHTERYCRGCRMYNGDAGGTGVECLWDDIRETESDQVVVTDPREEWVSNQKKSFRTVWTAWNAGARLHGGEAML